MALRSKSLFKELHRVLPFSEMHALIARLSVLDEDLRIETFGIVAEADSLGKLDYMDSKYRLNYFLRQSIATLVEIAEALRMLNENPDFQPIKISFDKQETIRWKRAVWFFECFEPILERVRNDIGGHFGHATARYAIQNLDSSTVGEIELKNEGPSRVGVKLHFAGVIAVTARVRHKGNE